MQFLWKSGSEAYLELISDRSEFSHLKSVYEECLKCEGENLDVTFQGRRGKSRAGQNAFDRSMREKIKFIFKLELISTMNQLKLWGFDLYKSRKTVVLYDLASYQEAKYHKYEALKIA